MVVIWVAMEFFFCFFLEFLEVFLHLLSTLFVFLPTVRRIEVFVIREYISLHSTRWLSKWSH